ncbi:MAG TPA: hypothetical protein VJJ47_01920 [Candidatus Paceibacterota bacterium]
MPMERQEGPEFGTTGGGPAAAAAPEAAPKTPLRWKDLPMEWVRQVRKERNGNARSAAGGMGLSEVASEEDIATFVAAHPDSAEAIERQRYTNRLLAEQKAHRAPGEVEEAPAIEAAEAPDFTPEDLSVAAHNRRKAELAQTVVPQPASPLPPEEISAPSVAKKPKTPRKSRKKAKAPDAAPEASAAPDSQPVTLGQLPPRVAETLNQQVVLAGLFGGRPFMAGDTVPKNALLWLEKRGSLTREQLAALGYTETPTEEPKQEKPRSQEVSPEERIAAARTWNELAATIESIPEIQGSQQTFTGEEMANIVRAIARGELDSTYATRALGIRDKVEGLESITPRPLPPVPGFQDTIPPQPGQERPPTPEEQLEAARLGLEEARAAFIPQHQAYLKSRREKGFLARAREALGLGQKESESELPPELRAAKEAYAQAKTAYGRQMYALARAEHLAAADPNLPEREQTAEAYGRARAFQSIFVNERAVLQKAEAESWTPKERGVVRKGFDWWRRRGKVTRALLSTAALTGVAFATGGGGAVAAGIFAGSRFVRSLIGMGVGHLAGKGFDRFVKKPGAADEKAERRVAELRALYAKGGEFWDTVEGTRAMEEAYGNTQEERDREERGRLLGKAIVMGVAAAGTGIGLRWLDQAWAHSVAPVKVPTPGPTPAPAPAPGPWPPDNDPRWGYTARMPVPNPAPDATPLPPFIPKAIPVPDATAVATPEVDNLWAMVRAKLDEQGYIDGLDTRGAQNNLIGTLYQKFVHMTPAELRSIGVASGNVHKIALGAKIDLSTAFDDTAAVARAYEHAGELSLAQTLPIEADASALNAFRVAHPGTRFTEELANRLIRERGH